jgi:hypothetical protein
MLSQDQKELFTGLALSLLEAYKVWMACLLAIFVPQYCPETQTTCTLRQNFVGLDAYNLFVLILNFVCLACFKYTFFVQNKREKYIITHLDVDPSFGDNSLEQNLQKYPKIFQRIQQLNVHLLQSLKYTTFIFVINCICSAVLVCYFYYDGFRTVTALIANVLLVCTRLYSAYDITKQCLGPKAMALSIFRTSAIAYNVIDPDYASVETSVEMQTTM